jgi:TM2 domain-containing membrane protein YozV
MADTSAERARFCSQCGQPVMVDDAIFCKECGAPLAGTVWFRHDVTWHPFTALILSVFPGLGHWYKGQPRRAIIWFSAVVFFYVTAPVIGLLLHMICAGNAALAGAIREEAMARSGRTGTDGFSASLGPGPR